MGKIRNKAQKDVDMTNGYQQLAEILDVPKEKLEELDRVLAEKTGVKGVVEQVAQETKERGEKKLKEASVKDESAEAARKALFEQIKKHEEELYNYIGITPEHFDFEKIAEQARKIATESKGFFLKKEFAEDILRKRPPEATMSYLGYKTVEEMLKREEVEEVFSALRFTENDEWMHETFRQAYTSFTPDDFEERPIKLTVLGDQWKEIAEKYIEKKHHNVSHLKEFGIIFLNPVAQTETGKFLRDFALLLHYFHEIAFYSKLFRRYKDLPDFNEKFVSLLRGDVPEKERIQKGEWLIIQKYLWKDDPKDPRLFIPRVNPEAMHWEKAEQDLVAFGRQNPGIGLEFWDNLSSIAGLFPNKNGEQELVSFDLEDNAMGVASASDERYEYFFYHQREALWNKIFARGAGGYEEMERYIVENMDTMSINL